MGVDPNIDIVRKRGKNMAKHKKRHIGNRGEI